MVNLLWFSILKNLLDDKLFSSSSLLHHSFLVIHISIFYYSLSYSKFSQVSITLLSIQADLDNDVVLIAPILPLISNSSIVFLIFVDRSKTHSFELISQSPSYSKSILIIWQNSIILISFYVFHNPIVVCWNSKMTRWLIFFENKARSGLLVGIKQSVCILKSQKILASIFLEWTLISAYTIWYHVQILSYAYFLVDNISHPIVPSLIILFYYLPAFAYFVINHLISVSTGLTVWSFTSCSPEIRGSLNKFPDCFFIDSTHMKL